jgi:hypothetical protein
MDAKKYNMLTKEEKKIIALHAMGESFDVIQKTYNELFGETLTRRQIGYKVGEIKKRLGYETQLQLGYEYANFLKNNYEAKLHEDYKENLEKQEREFHIAYDESFMRGFNAGKDGMKESNDAKLKSTANLFTAYLFIAVIVSATITYLLTC